MKKAIILIIILSIVSCKNTNNNAINNEVIAFMIDKKALPLVIYFLFNVILVKKAWKTVR